MDPCGRRSIEGARLLARRPRWAEALALRREEGGREMDGSEGIGRRNLLKGGAAAGIGALAAPAQAAGPGAKLEAAEVAEIVKEWPQASRDAVAATFQS